MKKPAVRMTLRIVSLIIFVLYPFTIHADIYKWIDEKGTYHFTDDYSSIPERYRQQVEIERIPEQSKPVPGTEGANKASTKSEIPLPGPAEPETLLSFSGVILTISSPKIVVAGGRENMTFLVPDDTVIQSDDGKNLSFGELKNGSLVTIEYLKRGDQNYARRMKVSMGAPKASRIPDAGTEKQAAPRQIQNPSDIQKNIWDEKKVHRLPDSRPKLPSEP